jgi:hypothetical protein
MRTVQRGDGAGSTLAAGRELGIGSRMFGKDLCRDGAIGASIAGAISLTLPAGVERSLEGVRSESGAWGQSHPGHLDAEPGYLRVKSDYRAMQAIAGSVVPVSAATGWGLQHKP